MPVRPSCRPSRQGLPAVDRRGFLSGALAAGAAAGAAIGVGVATGRPRPAAADSIGSRLHRFRIDPVATGLDIPWAIGFLPTGDVLVTERAGRLRRIRAGRLQPQPITGVPAVWDRGQGGLLDLLVDPDFASTRRLYLSYAKPGGRNDAGTAVAVARLTGDRLTGVRDLLAVPPSSGGRHFGSRLGIGGDGMLHVTAGDRGRRQRAQIVGDLAGAVWRLAPDGTIPADNPFRHDRRHHDALFTIGHRNPQGLAVHPDSGEIWVHEHGPRGGDEVNRLVGGRNYGWPIITHGREYSGGQVGAGITARDGLEQPLWHWTPSIAPSGMAFYTGDAFPGWRGSLFVGALAGTMLSRLTVDGTRITAEERLLDGVLGRIRDVRQGPDGMLWLASDDGMVVRLVPA